MSKYISATFSSQSFHCPNCGVLAQQAWSYQINCRHDGRLPSGAHGTTIYSLDGFSTAKCSHCFLFSIWLEKSMIFPLTGNVEQANADLPPEIKVDYDEARNIVSLSPRGAAALLRLAIQKLCGHLGEKGKSVNDDIADLVKRGLPIQLQQALDSVRVIGNNAVHPGVIDLNDDPETAIALFSFVNIICDFFITQPKKIAEVYDKLPQRDRDNITKRDT